MELNQAYSYIFGEIRGRVRRIVSGPDAPALAWRPDAEANSIAWLVWHLTRVADDHVSEIAGQEQVWSAGGWAQRFGLPPGYTDSGYGHSAEDVARIAPPDAQVLIDYNADVTTMVLAHVDDLAPEDFDRVIDRSYDPPVTVGVRLASVIGDAYQHVGQAAYVRGLHERRD